MPKVYILCGETNDYEAHARWIHSVYFDEDKALVKLKEMKDFLQSLPNDGKKPDLSRDINGVWNITRLVGWQDDCRRQLKKKDKKSSFYGFGASYSIEAIDVSE
jgi:hypothetical protein